jgi:nitrogen fixation/metabolism regulation signal transduction histidine kinase
VVYLAAVVDPTGTALGSVEASLPVNPVAERLEALRFEITLIVLFATGLAALLAVLLARVITRPIRAMQSAVERLPQGDMEARAPVSGVAEVRELATAYNHMLDWLSEDVRLQVRRAEKVRLAEQAGRAAENGRQE